MEQIFDAAKDIWWVFGTGVGIILALVKFGYTLREQQFRIQMLEKQLKEVAQDSAQLTVALLAVLDGLKQQGCNGEVTVAHTALKKYLATHRMYTNDFSKF